MKIYRICEDVTHYQSFALDDPQLWKGDLFTFDCSSKESVWVPPAVYVLRPLKKLGNFFYLTPGALLFDSTAMDQCGDLFERSGEILPISFDGVPYYALNVTECINVLDQKKTSWIVGETTGARIWIRSYGFHPKRLTETPLFKIPETLRTEILTVEGLKDPEDEFKGRVERCGLRGLIFEEIWNDQHD